MPDYNYGPGNIQLLVQKRLEDEANRLKNESLEPNAVAALTALLASGASQGGFGTPQTGARINWDKFLSPEALTSSLRAGLQPKAGNARDVFTGFGAIAETRAADEKKMLEKEERNQKQLMELLQRRQDVLKEYDVVNKEGPGVVQAGEYLPGVMPTGSMIKRKSPLEAMLAIPGIGSAVMKAMGAQSGPGGGPYQMYNQKTKDWATADTMEDIAQGYREGYELYFGENK